MVQKWGAQKEPMVFPAASLEESLDICVTIMGIVVYMDHYNLAVVVMFFSFIGLLPLLWKSLSASRAEERHLARLVGN